MNLNCKPSSSTHFDSPSARLTTSTLTRDVPDSSDEPLAAVDVGKSFLTASTSHSSFSPVNQSICPNSSTDLGSTTTSLSRKRTAVPQFSRSLVESNINRTNAPRNTSHRWSRQSRAKSKSSDDTSQSDDDERIIAASFALQWNICGLRSHQSELQMLVAKHQPTVIALQETNVNPQKLTGKFLGNKYDFLFSHGSTHGRQGAGMAIKSGTPFQRIPLQTNIQAVAVQLFVPVKITVASIYLPPKDKDAASLMQKLLDELPKPILLLGDLNAHHTAWGSRCSGATEARKRGEQIFELVVQNDMIVLNNGSHTRIDPVTGNTQALDVSLCSTSVATKFNWKTLTDSSDSDHLPIVIDTMDAVNALHSRAKWLYAKANWERFEDLTSKTLRAGNSLTVEEFSNKLILAAESSIPKSAAKRGPKSVPWWSEDVEVAVKLRRKRLRTLRRMSNDDPRKPQALQNFQEARSIARKTIENAKQTCWEDFVTSINPNTPASEVWNKINRLQGKRTTSTITLNLPNGFTNNGKAVSEALADEYESKSSNSHYSEKFRRQHKFESTISQHSQRPNLYKRYNTDFSIEELMWALDRKGGPSIGADNIGYPMLQRLPMTSKVALLELFNRVWDSGKFPEQWKLGTVIPIPKPDADRSLADGYRPIALLSCLGKVFERMVNRRLITELETNKKLDSRQHAFRSGKGVESHLAHLESLLYFDMNEHVEIVSLDISKAYDTTWKPGILRTLKEWKICGRMLNMLSSFLANRRFQVCANGTLSSPRKAENGVPQGSILSVTLFLVAMQPIFDKIPADAEILLYADDVILVVKGSNRSSVRQNMRKAVKAATEWAASVGFSIAPSKSKLLHCCRQRHRKRGRPIRINNSPIPQVRKMKILGIWVDSNINFKQHLASVKSSCRARINILRILGCRLKRSTRCGRTVRRVLINPEYIGIRRNKKHDTTDSEIA
ncbi:hypothetical protein RP20_CCG028398 [Aedes albopictus]|nr:hypothetical protein RP20_CCG028398 [Aedes albopictus]